MISFAKARTFAPPGEEVFTVDKDYKIIPCTVLEVCSSWLRTTVGNLDFQDHGYTWWLTRKVAMENTT